MEQKRILLVEDNPDDELLTLDALRVGGVTTEIVVARDGAEAVDYLFGTGDYNGRDTTVQPQLILLDLKLPKLSGHDVLRRVRADQRTRLIPVVILTSSNEPSDLERGYENGVNSYVQKPVEFEEFIHAVRTMGMYWLLFNQVPVS